MFELNQWVNWQPVTVPGELKDRKVPSNGVDVPVAVAAGINAKGEQLYEVINGINHLSQNNWCDYLTVASRSTFTGFVFTELDPYFVVDIDHALQPDGTWSQLAQTVMSMFPGAYIEISHSGDGLHIIAQGILPDGFKHKNTALGLEVYDRKRYIAITRNGVIGHTDINHQAALNLFCSSYMETTLGGINLVNWSNVAREDWIGPDDDDELINRMLASKPSTESLWTGKSTIVDLWTCNEPSFLRTYPDNKGGYDRSSVDAALFSYLAFWTGCNHERMERIARKSALYRDKWDRTADDYVKRSCMNASGICQRVYRDPRAQNETPVVPMSTVDTVIPVSETSTGSQATIRGAGYQFLSPDQQIDFFKGCVYVRDTHRVMIPDGSLLSPEQFKAVYSIYDFALDNMNDKISKCAWEVFTKSKAVNFLKVVGLAFRPDLEPGAIITVEGRDLVNSYYPVPIKEYAGDVTPFLELVGKLFPHDHDRQIILAYMSAIKQHIGSKFQWSPLIQGVEGNGKSLLMRCVSYAVGKRLSHFPNPNDLSNKFNYWIEGTIFAGVEEVHVSDKRDALNALKIMITNKDIEIQPKGGNQYLGDNRANFIMCTNHQDAINKTVNDRRYAPFFTPHQVYQDILNDGMGGEYFPNLYKWLDDGGYAMVSDFFKNYAIPDELNPATKCHRAPTTTSTNQAIEVSLGPVEQEVKNAVEEGLVGFRGGWISSIELDKMLKRTDKAKFISRNRRGNLLGGLHYNNLGRSSQVIVQEGGRPILYIQSGIIVSDNPASDYIKAQGYLP